jgi:hypothetical protein
MPDSWDYNDPATLSGLKDFSETNGAVVDGLQLGDLFLVYKEDSVWGMTFIGAPLIFRFFLISRDINAWSRNCIMSFPGGHAVLTNGDFIVHDGTGQVLSPLTKKMQKWLFQNISTAERNKVFLTKQPLHNEIWICFPTGSDSLATKALVWNWQTNATHIRDLEGYRAATFGLSQPPEESATWEGDTLPWSASKVPWDWDPASVSENSLVMTGRPNETARTTSNTSFFRLMDVYDTDVQQNEMLLRREDIALAGQKSDGSPRVDRKIRKLLTRLVPRMEISGGGMTVTVRIGGRDNPHDPISWDFSKVYDPLTEEWIYCLVNHSLLSVEFKIVFTDGVLGDVKFYGYDLELNQAGLG